MTTTHTHQAIRKYFTSLRHAQILGSLFIGSLVIAGSTFAAPLQIPNLSRANIGIQKIFLSTDGTNTSPGGTTTISLDGTDGDVEIGGLVQMTSYPCTTADCILTVQAGGGTLKLTGAPLSNTTNSTGGELFTKRGGSPLDTGAVDIYFADPVNTSVTGTPTDSVKVRIGLQGAGTGTTDAQLIVRGKVESRERLDIKYPFINANKTNLTITAGERTENRIFSDYINNQNKALTIVSTYYTGFLPSQWKSNIILRSGTGAVSTHVGINTPSGTYATRALDVAGQTLSRQTLEVVSGSSAFYARPSTVSTAGVVGIATNTPNTTDGILTVSGNTRLFGKTSFIGNQTNLDSTNNGMTSTKLMEINKNTPTTLTLEQVGCKILSVTETGHMVLTQVDASLCTPNPPHIEDCPPLPLNAIANTVTSIMQTLSGGIRWPIAQWEYNIIPSTTECRYTCAPGYVMGSNITPGYNYGLGSGNWTMTYGGSPGIRKQSNGKTIIFSHYLTHYNGVPVNGIARLNTDGSLDTTFNPGGSNFTLNAAQNIGSEIHIQPDDKIVLVGMFTHYNSTPSRGIIRLNSGGSIDTSFNVGSGFNGIVQGLRPLPNNEYFVLGYSTTSYKGVAIPNLAKLNTNGTLDTAFLANYTPAAGSRAVYDIQTQSNGKYIFGFAGPTSQLIKRYNTNGTVDNTFNNGGVGFTPANAPGILRDPLSNAQPSSNANVSRLAILPNDSIIAVGAFSHYNNIPARNIVKINENGTINNTFMSNIGSGLNGYATVTVYDSFNDRVFVGGSFSTLNNQSAMGLIAINQDGTINNSFPTTGFNKIVYGVTILDQNTFYVQGEFTAFGSYSTLPGAVVFGPGCIPEPQPSALCGTANGSTVPSIPTTNLCAVGNTASVVSYNPAGLWTWNCTNGYNTASCAATYVCEPTIINSSLGSGSNGAIGKVIKQPDGKFIIVGQFNTYNGVTQRGITRLNTDGTIDTSFNVGGSGFNVALGGTQGRDVALQPNGKIIVVGWFTNYNGTPANRIIRLNSDGTIDPTFIVGAGFNDHTQNIHLQADGTMFILGWFTNYNGTPANYMIKLTSTGAVDTSFVMGSSFNDIVYDIARQTDGKIVVGGKFTSYNGNSANFIVRLNTNGSIDNTFNMGTAFSPIVGGGSNPTLYDVLIQPDGKIVAGGWFSAYNGTPATGLVRLNTNGTIDNTFNIGNGFNDYVIGLEYDLSNNLILVGGGFTNYNGTPVQRMIRLTTGGVLNSSIATNFNGPVGKMQFLDNNDTLYIPGAFSQLNSTTANNIAIIKMVCDGEYACGSADGQTFASAPTSNLCDTNSVASAVSLNGSNWLRSCTNGTNSSNCLAYKPTPPTDGCYTCATGYILTGDIDNDGIPNCYTGSSNNNNSTGYFSQSRGTSGGWTVTHYADDGTSGPTINIGGGLWSGGVLGSVASPRCGCDIDPLSHDCPPTLYIKTGVTYPDPTQCIDLIGGLGSPNTVGYDYKRGFTARRVPSSGGSNGGNSGNSIISINANYTTGYACTALCGLAHGLSMPNPPSNGGFSTVGGTYYPASPSNLCSTGTASTLSGPTPWTWSCTGLSGAVVSCFANQSINGLCGSANGQPSVSAPNSNLCSAGTATLVTSTTLANGYSGRSWSCNGTNGGTNASCGSYVPLSCSAVYARDQWTGYYTMSSNTGSWSVPYTAYSTSSSTSLSIPPCAGPGIITPSWDYVGLLNGNYMTTFPWLNGINTSDIVVISGSSTSVINIVPWGAITHPYVLADDVGTSCYVTYHQHPGLHNAIYTKVGYVSDTGENCYPHAESCGPAHGNTYADATAANNAGPLCTNGTTASVASLGGSGPWDRDCLDAGMNVVSSCHADTRAGVCGPADGGLYLDASYANSAGLCNNGIATPGSLVDPGPWTWSCSGTPLVSCNADIDKCTVDPVDLDCSGTNYEPVCGCDNNTYFNDCYAQTAGIGSRTPGACRPESGECGNSIVDMGEQCDDGNNIPNDGCDNSCQLTITVSDLGCADGATMVSYTIGDDDNFDPTVKIQGPYLPNNAYKNWIYNYFTQGGTISPSQNLGNMDTNNNNDYYLAHIKLPPAPDPSMRVECIGFELKAKESSSLMSTDSLYLMSKNGAVDENNYGSRLGDYAGLVSQFDAICSMNNSLFIPYAGTNTTVPFTLNVTACPIDIVNSINNGNDDIYLRGQDDHNADYVRIHIGYL